MSLKKHPFLILVFIIIISIPPLAALAIQFPDPLNADSPYELVARVIRAILGIIGVLALVNFIIAGFGIITSQGSSDKLQKNKDNLVWTVIGIALLLGAYSILSYIISEISGQAL